MRQFIIFISVLSLLFLPYPVPVFAWVGSDPTIEIISPDGINDNSVLAISVKVVVRQKNTSQGIDYGKYYLVEDTNADSIVNQAEWDNKTVITGLINDINQETSFAIGWLKSTQVTPGKYYFVIGVGKDLNGDTSSDTMLMVGENSNGGGSSGIADKAIARWKCEGVQP